MKPSHLRTPRTLAECNFQTGYGVSFEPKGVQVLGWAVTFAIFAALGLMLLGLDEQDAYLRLVTLAGAATVAIAGFAGLITLLVASDEND